MGILFAGLLIKWGGPPREMVLHVCVSELITSAGQGLGGGVDLCHPTGGGHDPLAVVHSSDISLIGELTAAPDPGHHGTVNSGCLHLLEVGGTMPKETINSVTYSLEASPSATGEASNS